jgi:hypothetical protein
VHRLVGSPQGGGPGRRLGREEEGRQHAAGSGHAPWSCAVRAERRRSISRQRPTQASPPANQRPGPALGAGPGLHLSAHQAEPRAAAAGTSLWMRLNRASNFTAKMSLSLPLHLKVFETIMFPHETCCFTRG